MSQHYFLDMIQSLRKHEEVVLYENILESSEVEKQKVGLFLEITYASESSNYPFLPPSFHTKAAIWGAEVAYIAAQLILFRQNTEEELPKLFPKIGFEITSSAILSADLCLRFLPEMLIQLKLIDPEDELIKLLEVYLKQFHYSGISYDLSLPEPNLKTVFSDECMRRLYIDRIISTKNLKLAKHPEIQPLIKGQLGIFGKEYWKEFTSEEN